MLGVVPTKVAILNIYKQNLTLFIFTLKTVPATQHTPKLQFQLKRKFKKAFPSCFKTICCVQQLQWGLKEPVEETLVVL
jgi:hypothetical protein